MFFFKNIKTYILLLLTAGILSCEVPDPPNLLFKSAFLDNLASKSSFPPSCDIWLYQEHLSDEFSIDGPVNPNKWKVIEGAGHANSPSKKENVFIKDGFLFLRNTPRVNHISEVSDVKKVPWIASAKVELIHKIPEPGYLLEARYKASNLIMTSSFWMISYLDNGEFYEVDIGEQWGNLPPAWYPYTSRLISYWFYRRPFQSGKGNSLYSSNDLRELPTKTSDRYYTYGLWWKDPKTFIVYVDGVKQIEKKTPVPFKGPFTIILDTESFAKNGIPSIESLKDNSKNAMTVNWVRVYKKASNNDSEYEISHEPKNLIKNGSFEKGLCSWEYNNNQFTYTTKNKNIILDGSYALRLKRNTKITQNFLAGANSSYTLSLYTTATKASDINIIANKNLVQIQKNSLDSPNSDDTPNSTLGSLNCPPESELGSLGSLKSDSPTGSATNSINEECQKQEERLNNTAELTISPIPQTIDAENKEKSQLVWNKYTYTFTSSNKLFMENTINSLSIQLNNVDNIYLDNISLIEEKIVVEQ